MRTTRPGGKCLLMFREDAENAAPWGEKRDAMEAEGKWVSKSKEFCIKNEDFCIKNDDFCSGWSRRRRRRTTSPGCENTPALGLFSTDRPSNPRHSLIPRDASERVLMFPGLRRGYRRLSSTFSFSRCSERGSVTNFEMHQCYPPVRIWISRCRHAAFGVAAPGSAML